jgi:hypothetical protein
MGQRHQLFVIAKIGNRYRGLAAIHHPWLYGATALKRKSISILNFLALHSHLKDILACLVTNTVDRLPGNTENLLRRRKPPSDSTRIDRG